MTTLRWEEADHGQPTQTFEGPTLVLVEGLDDRALLKTVLEYLGLGEVTVLDMKGKDNWPRRLRTVAEGPDFRQNVRSIGLVRDADGSPASAFESCAASIRSVDFPVPSKVETVAIDGDRRAGVFIMPGGAESGAIENLLLRASDPTRVVVVEEYLDKVSAVTAGNGPRNRSKGEIQALMAGLEESPTTLRVALRQGIWSMDHAAFDSLRRFLTDLTGS